jgi:2-dehydro-3-deoxyphosphooctonate aldolase (KDO 8-P synthase)
MDSTSPEAAQQHGFWMPQPGGQTVAVGNSQPLLLIAGPCMAESYELCLEVARHMKALAASLGLPYVFKASYDKANRSSGSTSRGPGLAAGLELLARVKQEAGVAVLTDVHETQHCAPAAEVADVLQVPAFLCRQTDLLLECARLSAEHGSIVNVKKGQFMAPWDMDNVRDKLAAGGCSAERGNPHLPGGMRELRALITERGASFGYNNLVVDMRSLLHLKRTGVPACFDATHSAQLPGGAGTSSGGQRHYIQGLATAAVSLGIAALFMEVHPDPPSALSDKETQWPLAEAEALLTRLAGLDKWAKG